MCCIRPFRAIDCVGEESSVKQAQQLEHHARRSRHTHAMMQHAAARAVLDCNKGPSITLFSPRPAGRCTAGSPVQPAWRITDASGARAVVPESSCSTAGSSKGRMKLKVNMSQAGSGLTVDESLDLYCGDGEQILQWVGYTACARLAYKRGEIYGRYLPQSVTNRDGQPQDVDVVLNEIFHDNDEIFVEYSHGPMPYRVRWEGRPRTPPFKWGDQGEILPPHDTWLHELDLGKEGLGVLVEADLLRADPSLLEQDLSKTKEILVEYAGALQMLFYSHSAEGALAGDLLGQITLPQFRGLMTAAKAVTPRLPPEKMDEIFTTVATSPQTLARKVDNKSGVSTFDLLDFMLAVVYVAHARAAAENPSQAGFQQLSFKLMTFIRDTFASHTLPELSKKLARFEPAVNNTSAAMLLKRGRRLTEQTLDSCQLKRVRSAAVKVDLRWLCTHLQHWSMLGRDFNIQELVTIAIFAKQTSTDPEKFVLHPQPLEYNYNEFERLLLGIAHHVFVTKKKTENFEQFLGEMLDTIYRKAGALVEVEKDAEEGHA